jgi:hypothetical protein
MNAYYAILEHRYYPGMAVVKADSPEQARKLIVEYMCETWEHPRDDNPKGSMLYQEIMQADIFILKDNDPPVWVRGGD